MQSPENESKKTMEKILAVLKLSNRKIIFEEKERILKNETKRGIYDLCDGHHTVNDIVSELKSTQSNISHHLADLLESGLVLYDEVKGKRYYYKSLE
jgi:DNA-binding transcriptional ArsR family regulator